MGIIIVTVRFKPSTLFNIERTERTERTRQNTTETQKPTKTHAIKHNKITYTYIYINNNTEITTT